MNGVLRLVAIASLTLIPTILTVGIDPRTAAIAQDEACYMITATGKRVSLGKLCGNGNGQVQPGATNRGYFLAPIKRRSGGTPVIDVTFNGNRTFEMLVDTGATGTVITRSMAQSLQIPLVGAGRFTLADGRSVLFPIGRLQSLSIDGATIRDVNVAITPDTADGLLGHDFLGNYDIKIKRDVIEFYPR